MRGAWRAVSMPRWPRLRRERGGRSSKRPRTVRPSAERLQGALRQVIRARLLGRDSGFQGAQAALRVVVPPCIFERLGGHAAAVPSVYIGRDGASVLEQKFRLVVFVLERLGGSGNFSRFNFRLGFKKARNVPVAFTGAERRHAA